MHFWCFVQRKNKLLIIQATAFTIEAVVLSINNIVFGSFD